MSFLKQLFIPNEIVLSNEKVVKPPFKVGTVVLIVIILLLTISAKITRFDLMVLFQGFGEVGSFFKRMIPPNWGYASSVFDPMLQTIAMSFLGTLLAAIVSLPVAYLSSSNMNHNPVTRTALRFIMSVFRTIPVLIIALIMTYIFGLNTFSGMLAIFLFTFSIITKMTYEQIELVDMGPFEASISTGATRGQSFIAAVLPQISGLYISTILYNLEMNIRSAAVLGYVGAGGIGILMNQAIGWRDYQRLSIILIMLLVTVVSIEALSRQVRKRLA
ncbi:phosphonate ABC transporter, permease protein PhnE [Erysipelothrix urinaevulpis]|uniref:phosphonate ABC transporter, permease protein PhnE n=1 Tax=Erysipelothrix urinaevulpis TaxID=2683717 RepID=UPI00135A7A34|nr:phosphonate ABC transporter, permease protein PhnE [Erysipelothrix urinaevulpis]